MNTLPAPSMVAAQPLRLGVHLLVAGSVALVSPFTALAWPFALVVGTILGSGEARRMRGEPEGIGDSVARGLLAGIGAVMMLIFGAIIGGVVAVAVVALASFSEKAAAHASAVDRGVARIVLFVVPLAAWLIVFPLLGLDVDLRIGG